MRSTLVFVLNPHQFEPTLPGLEHLRPGKRPEPPDPALEERNARRDINRSIVRHGGRDAAQNSVPGREVNNPLPVVGRDVDYESASYPFDLVDPFSHSTFSRHGVYREIPTADLVTPQQRVNEGRVRQITKSPELGRNPRLPHERPLVVQEPGRRPTVIQGNHRAASHLMRNEMFVNAQVLDMTPEVEARVYSQQSRLHRAAERASEKHQERKAQGRAGKGKIRKQAERRFNKILDNLS